MSFPSDTFFIGEISLNVSDTSIDAFLTFHTGLEGKCKNLGMLTKIPSTNLAASKLHAIHTRLLTGTNTDHHTVLGETNGVGLCVFEADRRKDHIPNSTLRNILVGCDNILHVILTKNGIIALLRKSHSINLTVFLCSRVVISSSLQDDEFTFLLGFQNSQCLRSVTGCYNSVRYFLLEDLSSIFIDSVRNSTEVSKGTHGIGISSSQVSQGGWGQGSSSFRCYLVSFTLDISKWDCHSSTCRTHVLETGGSSKSSSSLKLHNKLPCIGSIQ
mmetsp:Transcript_4677/g.6931  ORF Transcript_4677/g.6931 Transcript_4677/m.6931 type:complete len:272 (-) Transcript_4677:832-1647(-)